LAVPGFAVTYGVVRHSDRESPDSSPAKIPYRHLRKYEEALGRT
jgi:hypothetical protein